MLESYCILTGDRCSRSPITVEPYAFFISEPYDKHRSEREKSINEAIKGYKFIISDHDKTTISITCKICQQIQSAHFGIVDITNYNRNVLIELGMLFGFNKPVLILLKHSKHNLFRRLSNNQLEIPSNIIGIEQIRYNDFADLEVKLKNALNFLFEISKKQAQFLLDLKPILELQIQQIELTIFAKKAINSHVEGEVQFYKSINGTPIFIVNKGTNDGIKENMILSVISLTVVNRQSLEEEVGRLIVKHAQEIMSQCQLVFVDPNAQQFWADLFQKGQVFKNVVRPFIHEKLSTSTEQELTEYVSKLKILLQGFNIITSDTVVK